MIHNTRVRLFPLFLLGALLAAACTAPVGDFSAEAFESLPKGVDVSFDNSSIEFTDVVNHIASDQWDVGAFSLGVGSNTEIQPGILVGDVVRVHAILNEDGTFSAREIALAEEQAMNGEGDVDSPSDDGDSGESLSGDELEFVGTVDAMAEDVWTIDSQLILVTTESEIEELITIGDMVKVHAFLSDTNELTAHEIELAEPTDLKQDDFDADDDLKYTGIIESIEGNTWVIGGETFHVDDNTEIDDDLAVGDTVEVYFFLSQDGLTIVREISSFDDESVGEDEADDMDDDDDDEEENDLEDDEGEDEHSGSSEADHSDSDEHGGSGNGEDD